MKAVFDFFKNFFLSAIERNFNKKVDKKQLWVKKFISVLLSQNDHSFLFLKFWSCWERISSSESVDFPQKNFARGRMRALKAKKKIFLRLFFFAFFIGDLNIKKWFFLFVWKYESWWKKYTLWDFSYWSNIQENQRKNNKETHWFSEPFEGQGL